MNIVDVSMLIFILLSGFAIMCSSKWNNFLKIISIVTIVLITLLANSVGVFHKGMLNSFNFYATVISFFLVNCYIIERNGENKIISIISTILGWVVGIFGLGYVLFSSVIKWHSMARVLFLCSELIATFIIIESLILLIKQYSKRKWDLVSEDMVLFIGVLTIVVAEILHTFKVIPYFMNNLFAISVLAISIVPKLTSIHQGLLPLSKEKIIEEMDDMLMILDNKDCIMDVNKAFSKTFDINNEAIGKTVEQFLVDLPNVSNSLALQVYEEGIGELTVIDDFAIRTYSIKVQFIRNKWNRTIGKMILLYDVSRFKNEIKELQEKGNFDNLTQVYNRNYFEKRVIEIDTQANLPISVIIGDLNSLKMINDTYGHAQGDRYLKQVAAIMKRSTMNRGDVFRTGGDEFCILLPKTSRKEAHDLLSALELAMEKAFSEGIGSVSLGWETKDGELETLKEVCDKADHEMYITKNMDKDQSKLSALFVGKRRLITPFETEKHSKRLEKLALKMGQHLGLRPKEMECLKSLVTLHDIGKYFVSEELLAKQGDLTKEEWEEIAEHTHIGYHLANAAKERAEVARSILSHHERWDGKGYPNGIKGEEIPYLARIFSIIEAFEVMTAGRPYVQRRSREEALDELSKCSGSQFDPSLVDKFIKIM